MASLDGTGSTDGQNAQLRSTRSSSLRGQPGPLIAYVCTVVALAGAVGVGGLAHTSIRAGDVAMFAALMGCGAVCIEAVRRMGMPAGVSKDMLSAWWIPVALLLPPPYAVLAPLVLYTLIQIRVRRTALYLRVFSSAAIALAGAAASAAYRFAVSAPQQADPAAWLTDLRVGIPMAVACAAAFSVINSGLVAVAAHLAAPEAARRELLRKRESLTLDGVALCAGVLVAVTTALGPALLLLTLPPVVLLQRNLVHAQLQTAARTDVKTGLLNAAAWQRAANAEVSRAVQSGAPLAVLIADIDHFKTVNDTHGHLVGDQVLVDVADSLRQQVRAGDTVGRFGGEEFVVLLPNAGALEACRVAERLRTRVSGLAVPADGMSVQVTISVGVALLRDHGEDLVELLAAADLALYGAKDAGRDRVWMSPPTRRRRTAAGRVGPTPGTARPD